ncbi:MAG TPA: hypothetical protein VMI54_11935 [Polyangiaceae bacterium]|nr:hypothetical protein [Polyangiaceae bacterium]
MVAAKRALPLVSVFLLGAFGACSSSRTDCTCSFDNDGQHRTLACGERACVGGVNASCAAKDEIVRGGDCVAPPDDTDSDAGGVTEEPPPASTACDDLSTFCSTSCNSPASVATDCLTTASSDDPNACADWSVANGALCSP